MSNKKKVRKKYENFSHIIALTASHPAHNSYLREKLFFTHEKVRGRQASKLANRQARSTAFLNKCQRCDNMTHSCSRPNSFNASLSRRTKSESTVLWRTSFALKYLNACVAASVSSFRFPKCRSHLSRWMVSTFVLSDKKSPVGTVRHKLLHQIALFYASVHQSWTIWNK